MTQEPNIQVELKKDIEEQLHYVYQAGGSGGRFIPKPYEKSVKKGADKLLTLFNKELARLTVEARSDELDKLIGNTLIPYTINIELIKEYVDNRSQALKSLLPEGVDNG